MSEATRYPDAVLAPVSWKTDDPNPIYRGNAIAFKAEQVMGLSGAQRAHVRLAEGEHHFCSADEHDTLFFPKTHPRDGHTRYEWVAQEDGSFHGFLVDDEARESVEWAKKNRGWMPVGIAGVKRG